MGGVNCEPEYVILIPEVQLFMLILMVFQLQIVRVYCIIGLFVLTPSFAVSDYYQFDDLLTSEDRSIEEGQGYYGERNCSHHGRVLGKSRVSI